MNHKKRFMGWRKRMPKKTQYLVNQVLERIVPEFERHGFLWYPDFQVGANVLPLQKREGLEWPTVEIRFVPKGPFFRIEFSALPEQCEDMSQKQIQREYANLACAPVWLFLCRKNSSGDASSGFGFVGILPTVILSPFNAIKYLKDWRKFFDSEVDAAVGLLPKLFEIFDKQSYRDWQDLPFGFINEHVFLSMSWKIRDDFEQTRQSKSPDTNLP